MDRLVERLAAFRELAIAFALAAIATGALFAAGLGGWHGRPDGCLVGGQCFCERDRGGLVRQPANTVSNLGFVAVGLGIAVRLGSERRRSCLPRPGNPMTETRFYPGFYAALTALLGPGSMALHASLTRWGSVLDLLSMDAYVAFLVAYAVTRWRGLSIAAFLGTYVALVAALVSVKLLAGRGSEAFGAAAGVALALEVRLRRDERRIADGRWLAAAAAVFLAAFAIWLGSRNGGPLCDPDSWLQGHAVWHLLCAVAALCLYGYARSERTEPRDPLPGTAAAAP